VTPDLSIVPRKYHPFISPPLRRVFLDAREDNSRAVVESLNAENAALKKRVTSLERHNDLLTDSCNSAHSTVVCLETDEESARLASYKARADALKDRQNLNRVRAEYNAFKFRATVHLGLALFSLVFFLVYFLTNLYFLRRVGPR
jgi:hypothetical protein